MTEEEFEDDGECSCSKDCSPPSNANKCSVQQINLHLLHVHSALAGPWNRHSHYSPITFLAAWYGVVYVIDFISIAMHMEAENGWLPISETYNNQEALLTAEPRPRGPVINRFTKLVTSQNF